MHVECLEMEGPLDAEEIEEITTKLGYATGDLDHFRIDPGTPDRVEYSLKAGANRERARSDLLEVIGAVRSGMRRGKTSVLWDGTRPMDRSAEEVHGELVRRKLLVEFGSGQVALGGSLMLLAEGIDRYALGIASSWDARRFLYPSLIPLEVLIRARYLESFPQYLTFACHLREDLEVLRDVVGRSVRVSDAASAAGPVVSRDALGPLDHVMTPAACLHSYQHLAGTRFAGPETISARVRCMRYEGKWLGGPGRLWDFSVREIIFFGGPEWVREARRKVLDDAIRLAEGLELSARATTATDSFFVDSFGKKAAFQKTFDTKYELRLDLPGTGRSLAAASFNIHHDHFARCFDLAFADGKPFVTGCVGFGLERFAYAVACQHGPDPEGWPELARLLVREEQERASVHGKLLERTS